MPEQIIEKTCAGPCGLTKPVESGFFRNSGRQSWMRVCKTCHRARGRKREQDMPSEVRSALYLQRRLSDIPGRRVIEKNQDRKRKENGYRRRPIYRAYHKRWRDGRKAQVFEAYGGICACCGEADIRLLTLDHLNNDGSAERMRYGARGASQRVYARLIKEGFPDGYQVLCFSCNTGRHIAGGVQCPHQLGVVILWRELLDYAKQSQPIAA